MGYEDTLIEEIATSEGDICLRDWSKMHGEVIDGESQLQIEAWTKAAESYGYYASKGHSFRLYIRTHDGYSEEDLKKDFEALKNGEKYLVDLRDHFYYGTRDFYCLTGTWTETGLTERQEWEVSGGMAEGLSNEEIAVFADPKFTYEQMFEIRTGIRDELGDLVNLYADERLDASVMEEIREGLTNEEITKAEAKSIRDQALKGKEEIKEEDTVARFTEGFTHAGIFHADDVFATAFLKTLNPDMEVHRVFRVPENLPESAIVYDIGLGKYDHHQKDNEIRENGVPYAAFGKLWRDFGKELGLSSESLKKIEESLVEKIDYADNTGNPEVLSTLISSMNPNWDEDTISGDQQFEKAVGLAQGMLLRNIEYYRSVERARDIIMEAAAESKDGVVILGRYVPQQALQEVPDAKFVIFPSNRGGWNIQTVPTKEDPTVGRVPFPQEWLGNPDKALGMTFCHPGNFLASTETLMQAIDVANIAISINKERTSAEKSVNAKLDELEASPTPQGRKPQILQVGR